MGRKPTLHNKCFRCIRKPRVGNDLEFVYECAWEVMEKMNDLEVNELARGVLQYVRNRYPYDNNGQLTDIVGDSYARIYMYTITHGGYLRESYLRIAEVRDTLQIAAKRSMPAWGICSMYERENVPIPQCWLDRYTIGC